MTPQGPRWGPGEMFVRDHRVGARSRPGTRQGTGLARQSVLELGTGNRVGAGTEPGIGFVYPVALSSVVVLAELVVKWRSCVRAVDVPTPEVSVRVVGLFQSEEEG